MEVTGKIIHALEKRSGVSAKTGNPWASREYVLEIPGQYPRHMCFTVFGEDRLKQFNLQRNEDVTIHFDIDAHEYQGKWFNQITAYNVVRAGQQSAPSQQPTPQPAANNGISPFPTAQPKNDGCDADDLPF
jgi:hypothetical protein